jgi:hypothetical protein
MPPPVGKRFQLSGRAIRWTDWLLEAGRPFTRVGWSDRPDAPVNDRAPEVGLSASALPPAVRQTAAVTPSAGRRKDTALKSHHKLLLR